MRAGHVLCACLLATSSAYGCDFIQTAKSTLCAGNVLSNYGDSLQQYTPGTQPSAAQCTELEELFEGTSKCFNHHGCGDGWQTTCNGLKAQISASVEAGCNFNRTYMRKHAFA